MDPINPWLDPVEVRRMAERLLKPASDPVRGIVDAGFDAAFVGFEAGAAPDPVSPAVGVPARIVPPHPEPPPLPPRISPPPQEPVSHVTPAAEADVPVSPAESQVEAPASTARGPFLDRIHRFRDWMRHHFAATGIFILDREGSVIFDESSHGRLHFLARSLAIASRRPGTNAGNVHVKIGAGATLEVIPVETPYGCLVLGAVVPEALQPTAVAAVMEALGQVAAPQA